jgi:hypothetical protein
MPVNSNNLRYAFEILCPEYTTDVPEIGLAGGAIRFITGRDNIDLLYEDDTSATGFKEGFLNNNPMTSLSTKVDLSAGGNFNTINSCTAAIDNTTNYVGNMLSNKIYLVNRKVNIYVVIDNKLYNRFGGVISEWKYNTTEFTFTCKDANEDNFKALPENDNQQTIIGKDDYSPLKLLESNTDYFDTFFPYEYKEITQDGSRLPQLTLIVARTSDDEAPFGADDLAGKYIRVRVLGEPLDFEAQVTDTEYVKIKSNSAMELLDEDPDWYSDYIRDGQNIKPQIYGVKVILERTADRLLQSDMVSGGDNLWRQSNLNNELAITYKTGVGQIDFGNYVPVKYFCYASFFNPEVPLRAVIDVYSSTTKYYVAQGELNDYDVNEDGSAALYVYDDTSKTYSNITLAGSLEYEAAEDRTILVIDSPSGTEVSGFTAIYADPDKSYATSLTPSEYFDFPNLYGKFFTEFNFENVITTGYQAMFDKNINPVSGFYNANLGNDPVLVAPDYFFKSDIGHKFHLEMPDDFNWDDYENIYLSMVYTASETSGGRYTVSEGDAYLTFRTYEDLPNPTRFVTKSITDDPATDEYTGDVYNDGGNQTLYSSKETGEAPVPVPSNIFNIPWILDGALTRTHDLSVSSYMWLSPIFDVNNREAGSYRPSIQAYPNINKIDDEDKYTAIEFDYSTEFKFQNNPMRGTGFNIMLEPSEELRKVYDSNGNVIYEIDFDISSLYLTGERTVNIEDLYIKTSGVNLSESEELPVSNVYLAYKYMLETVNNFTDVDYGNVATKRNDWEVSRTITTKESTKNLIKNLAEQSFVALWTNRFGNITLDAFTGIKDEYTSTTRNTWTHDNTVIKQGSIASVVPINQSKIYNNIELEYDYSYAEDSFQDTYYVTNVSADEFPETGDYSDYSNVSDRTTASYLWGLAREVYLRYNIEKSAPNNISQCFWFNKPKTTSENIIEGSLFYFLNGLIQWAGQQKNTIKYKVDISPDTITIDLLDRVTFTDYLITDNVPVNAWVIGVGVNNGANAMDIEIIVEPDELIKAKLYSIIDEMPETTVVIDESLTTTNVVEETFEL